jgi:hypothetical protein
MYSVFAKRSPQGKTYFNVWYGSTYLLVLFALDQFGAERTRQ